VIGENLDFCNEDPIDVVLSLLVDDNVPSRGHRKVGIILWYPSKSYCGETMGNLFTFFSFIRIS